MKIRRCNISFENKVGRSNSADLARAEENISKKNALELFENGVLNKLEAGKFSVLKAIHKYLFDEIYDFSVELRTANIGLDVRKTGDNTRRMTV